jgi:hypothetical protein
MRREIFVRATRATHLVAEVADHGHGALELGDGLLEDRHDVVRRQRALRAHHGLVVARDDLHHLLEVELAELRLRPHDLDLAELAQGVPELLLERDVVDDLPSDAGARHSRPMQALTWRSKLVRGILNLVGYLRIFSPTNILLANQQYRVADYLCRLPLSNVCKDVQRCTDLLELVEALDDARGVRVVLVEHLLLALDLVRRVLRDTRAVLTPARCTGKYLRARRVIRALSSIAVASSSVSLTMTSESGFIPVGEYSRNISLFASFLAALRSSCSILMLASTMIVNCAMSSCLRDSARSSAAFMFANSMDSDWYIASCGAGTKTFWSSMSS